ncbi:MAG: Wadjet anti-phage system protein JetD domain-containing protein [Prosthecobacter sp.]|uniref:Wadjet anti-phage system protein JetD domain-containing protein n=1 Tax=Prosthecobacter sp. TaxID=1965333 RepID=UPI00390308D3
MRWLQTLHEKWLNSRKRRVTPAMRSRPLDWEDLLDAADLKTAEERQAAVREAEKIPQLKLHRLKGRPHIVLKIEVPLEFETWLHAQFGSQTGAEAQQAALAVVERYTAKTHPLLPEAWNALLSRLKAEFALLHAVEPFRWREANRVEELLKLLLDLTAREWPEGTLIRDASTQIGQRSKYLEEKQAFIERALELLFGRETPLEALGIQTSNSVLHYCGPLMLHFADHTKPLDLRFESTLSVAELERATHITTTAERLLTVENRKTTFLQLARADAQRTTLIVATSFPTQAVRLMLQKLPQGFPHHHFGDTDPSGWDILRKLREVSDRGVHSFEMTWRPKSDAAPLTQRDQQILTRLLTDPRMADCREELIALGEAGTKGDFEQESLGRPTLDGWPFYETNGDVENVG